MLVLVIAALLLSSLVPSFHFGTWDIKKIDLLADIKNEPLPVSKVSQTDSIQADSTIVEKKKTPKPVAEAFPCPNKNCLQDFSPNKSSLKKFFRALKQSNRRQVRIAFYGDSFIEGDVLCGSFRDTLQELYGGRGVGFVPVASEVAQYRTSIQHTYSNWEAYSLIGKQSPQ
ncbi:MAG TPA: hypothetical protein PKH83_06075, partial [Cyclobacteriaceae bacterium]|nr:hypothetical protein [Cyclobacteriaceae bacterium]